MVKLNLFCDIFGLNVFILVSNEDQVPVIPPSVFLHPVLQSNICRQNGMMNVWTSLSFY